LQQIHVRVFKTQGSGFLSAIQERAHDILSTEEDFAFQKRFDPQLSELINKTIDAKQKLLEEELTLITSKQINRHKKNSAF
jgi:hypothetical protein